MARIRTIKPEFFTSEDIVSMSPLARLFYVSLWCESDREGRLEWKPGTFKMRYLPGDDCSVQELATELIDKGLITLYTVNGKQYAHIPTFTEHQVINNRESASTIPAKPGDATLTRESGVKAEGKEGREGKEGKGKEGKGSLGAGAPAEEIFEQAFAAFPKRFGGNPKPDALKSWNARIAEGVDPVDMLAGTQRYAEHIRVAGKLGTEFVMQAVRFFGKSKHYAEPWQAEAPPAARAPSRSTAAMGANAQVFEDPFAKRAAA